MNIGKVDPRFRLAGLPRLNYTFIPAGVTGAKIWDVPKGFNLCQIGVSSQIKPFINLRTLEIAFQKPTVKTSLAEIMSNLTTETLASTVPDGNRTSLGRELKLARDKGDTNLFLILGKAYTKTNGGEIACIEIGLASQRGLIDITLTFDATNNKFIP